MTNTNRTKHKLLNKTRLEKTKQTRYFTVTY